MSTEEPRLDPNLLYVRQGTRLRRRSSAERRVLADARAGECAKLHSGILKLEEWLKKKEQQEMERKEEVVRAENLETAEATKFRKLQQWHSDKIKVRIPQRLLKIKVVSSASSAT